MASAGAGSLETNDDVERLFEKLIEDAETGIIFMNVAMVDYDGVIEDGGDPGKYGSRLKTREQPNPTIQTKRVRKFLPEVREKRPDIFLVAFKTTCNATLEDMQTRGGFLLKGANCNLVLVNDTGTRQNIIVGPDGVCWPASTDRKAAVEALVNLAIKGFAAASAPSAIAAETLAGCGSEEPVAPPVVSEGAVAPLEPVPVPGAQTGATPVMGPSVAEKPAESKVPQFCTVITGGSRGIGFACAKKMAQYGPVFLIGQTESHLQAAVEELRKAGLTAEYQAGDVADFSVADAAVARVKELGWTVRNLVCNAGIGGKGAITTFDRKKWLRVFDVNVHGTFYFIHAFAPLMVEQKAGSICVISSTLGVRGHKYDSCYAATKHAQVGMARSLGMELAKHGITVVPVCPSFVETDMLRKMVANLMHHKNMTEKQAEDYLAEKNPQRRIIPADEVAEAVALVCSGILRCLNGEPLVLDGGAE
jgi:3-hydroxybutyrate dehydrogenase